MPTALASTYAAAAIAPTTRRAYSAGERRYVQFCNLCHWSPLPASDAMLSNFAAHLANSVSPGTIQVYISAVRNWHLESGFPDPCADALLLRRVLRGIARTHGTEVKARRLPITLPLLEQLVRACETTPLLNTPDRSMLRCAMLTAFYGFLRCSEFTGEHVQRRHVTATYLTSSSHGPDAALFVHANGQRLTRETFTAMVRILLSAAGYSNASDYASHSFRIGAATTAAAAGVADSTIRLAGRWKSDACLAYIRTSEHSKCQIARQMSTAALA